MASKALVLLQNGHLRGNREHTNILIARPLPAPPGLNPVERGDLSVPGNDAEKLLHRRRARKQ